VLLLLLLQATSEMSAVAMAALGGKPALAEHNATCFSVEFWLEYINTRVKDVASCLQCYT
jgi:hypothetical protein